MNWDAVSAIAEVVSAVAVLVTLAYLALQIQHNTREIRAENIQKVTDSFNAVNLTIFENDEVAELFLKGLKDYSSLSEKEKLRFDFGWLAAFRIYDSMYYQTQTGTGEGKYFTAELGTIKWFFSHKGVRDWWGAQQFAFSPGFRDYVEKSIDEFENKGDGGINN